MVAFAASPSWILKVEPFTSEHDGLRPSSQTLNEQFRGSITLSLFVSDETVLTLHCSQEVS